MELIFQVAVGVALGLLLFAILGRIVKGLALLFLAAAAAGALWWIYEWITTEVIVAIGVLGVLGIALVLVQIERDKIARMFRPDDPGSFRLIKKIDCVAYGIVGLGLSFPFSLSTLVVLSFYHNQYPEFREQFSEIQLLIVNTAVWAISLPLLMIRRVRRRDLNYYTKTIGGPHEPMRPAENEVENP
ncbi:MAG: hypothetical protein AB7F86_09615 [Bdellovibrionales bacterium]